MKMKKNEQQGISFDKIIFEKINVEINPEFKLEDVGKGLDVDISLNANVNIDKSRKLLVLELETTIFKNTENRPFNIFIKAIGFFSVKDEADVPILEEFSKINAPDLMFPFVRETIADLTLKTGYPPLLLPPINIVALIGKSRNKSRGK
ncbi:MAG: protein-export chaperone SecB [bacterium]